MEGNRAWIYCRTAQGRVASLDMLEQQREQLEAHAAERGFKVQGISADRHNGVTSVRPGFLEVNRVIGQRQVDILLLYSISRMFRPMEDMVQYWTYLNRHGVRLCTLREGDVDLSMELEITRALHQAIAQGRSR